MIPNPTFSSSFSLLFAPLNFLEWLEKPSLDSTLRSSEVLLCSSTKKSFKIIDFSIEKVPKFLLNQDLGLGIRGNVVAVLNWAESAQEYF